MMVGLGDYTGGELCVEGESHSVKYQPLSFDSCGRRHWTLPFTGTRFTLAYFTPCINDIRTREDARTELEEAAAQIANKHRC